MNNEYLGYWIWLVFFERQLKGEGDDTYLSRGSEDHFLEWKIALCLLWSIENLSRLSTEATFSIRGDI